MRFHGQSARIGWIAGTALLASTMLSGCAAVSFAPPSVPVLHPIETVEGSKCDSPVKEASIAGSKVGDPQKGKAGRNGGANPDGSQDTKNDIPENVDGALQLIHNFTAVYSCAQRDAADGRQAFQVTSFLTMAAAVLVPALGGSDDAALVLGATGAGASHLNTYYSPKEKAAIFSDSLEAVTCIRAAAVGMDSFDLRSPAKPDDTSVANAETRITALKSQITPLRNSLDQQIKIRNEAQSTIERSAKQRTSAAIRNANGANGRLSKANTEIAKLQEKIEPLEDRLTEFQNIIDTVDAIKMQQALDSGKVQLPAERRYFQTVQAALRSVHIILGRRLSDAGTFNTEGISSDLEALIKKRDDAKAARDKAAEQVAGAGGAGGVNGDSKARMASRAQSRSDANKTLVDVSIDLLYQKLQICVIRAKSWS